MNMWVRRQILALWGCFSNASHQVRQQMLTLWERFSSALHWVHQQIPTLREWYYNTSDINQLIVISATLFMLILPLYLFVPMPPMGAIFTGIFFGTGIVRFLWRERYPALKRWIIETEHGQIMAKILTVTKNQSRIHQLDQYLDYVGPTLSASSPLDVNNVVTLFAKKYHHRR
jgi:hypothetical protein